MSERDAALTALAQEIARLTAPLDPHHVDLSHLPAGAGHFLGRAPELASLDAAWAAGSGIAVAEVIAPGGTGKTALVGHWLDGRRAAGWGGALAVYGWSFYSQGTSDDLQALEVGRRNRFAFRPTALPVGCAVRTFGVPRRGSRQEWGRQ